jgi:hypothetical protein
MDADVAQHIGRLEGRVTSIENAVDLFRQESAEARERLYRRLEEHARSSAAGHAELKDMIQAYATNQKVGKAQIAGGWFVLAVLGGMAVGLTEMFPTLQKLWK